MQYFDYNVGTLLVPTGAPMDVEILSISSTSITVAWRSPSFDKQNGDIFSYDVFVESSKDHLKFTVNSTVAYTTDMNLSPLKPYLTYNLSVAAVNINGSGPHSVPIRFTTSHSGLLLIEYNACPTFYLVNISSMQLPVQHQLDWKQIMCLHIQ